MPTILKKQGYANVEQGTGVLRADKRTTQIDYRQRTTIKLPDIICRFLRFSVAFTNNSSWFKERFKNIQPHLQRLRLTPDEPFVLYLPLEGVVIEVLPALVGPCHVAEYFHYELAMLVPRAFH